MPGTDAPPFILGVTPEGFTPGASLLVMPLSKLEANWGALTAVNCCGLETLAALGACGLVVAGDDCGVDAPKADCAPATLFAPGLPACIICC